MTTDPHQQPTADGARVDETREAIGAARDAHAGETRDLGSGPAGAEPAPGLRIGGYELLETIGSGGFGVVMRAREQGTGRDVALKLLRTQPKPRVVERFQREGRAAAALDHPGIVRVHAAGEHHGQPWLAYELVPDCRPLDAAFSEADLRARVGWVRDAARALGAAHAVGILHRDVKPDNLLVDAAERLRVVDFGLALLRGEARLTETNLFLGTPAYAAPEQVRDPKRVGAPADVWSLGVILFEAITGEHPLGEVRTPSEVLSRLLVGTLPRPSDVSDVDPSLERICLRALRRDPGGRYADGEALAAALDDWLAGRGGASGRPAWALGAAGVAGIAAVALFAAAASTRAPEAATPTRARAPASPAAPPRSAPTSSLRLAWSDDAVRFVARLGPTDARLVTACGDQLRALRGATGAPAWRAKLPGRVTALAALQRRGGALVFASDADGVGCWTAAGVSRWRREVPGARKLLATARGERVDLVVSDGQALVGFDAAGTIAWRLTAAWDPRVYVGLHGARLLLTRNQPTRIRLFHLEAVGEERLGRLLSYSKPGLGRPVLAELDPVPGLELVLPSPGLLVCRSASNERKWDYRVPGSAGRAPRLLLGPRSQGRPPDVLVVTERSTIRLAADGSVRRTYEELDLRCALPGGGLIGVRGEALVRLEADGAQVWRRSLPGAARQVETVRWGDRSGLLVRTAGRVLLLDAAEGLELGAVSGAALGARVEAFRGGPLLLIQREPERLEAWR